MQGVFSRLVFDGGEKAAGLQPKRAQIDFNFIENYNIFEFNSTFLTSCSVLYHRLPSSTGKTGVFRGYCHVNYITGAANREVTPAGRGQTQDRIRMGRFFSDGRQGSGAEG